MAQKRKTPARLIAMIKSHEDFMDHASECIRVKLTVQVESQAEHISSNTVEYFYGMAQGMSEMLERELYNANCFAGYHHVGRRQRHNFDEGGYCFVRPIIGSDNADFADWRRHYIVRSA
jgi:hypothetical protein